MHTITSELPSGWIVSRPTHGTPYLEGPVGKRLAIPSGGEGDDPPAPAPVPPSPAPGDPPPPGSPAPFSAADQERLNAKAKDIKLELEKKYDGKLAASEGRLKKAEDENARLRSEFEPIKSVIEKLTKPQGPDGDPDDPFKTVARIDEVPEEYAKNELAAALWRRMSREGYSHNQKVSTLEKQVADQAKSTEQLTTEIKAEREKREAAETRAIMTSKRNVLLGALTKLGVINPAYHLPVYESRLEYDAESDTFRYRTREGELTTDIDAALKAEFPADFVKPLSPNGGSGAQGARGTVPAEPRDRKVQRLEGELKAVDDRVARQGHAQPRDAAERLRLERQLNEAKRASQPSA